MPKSSLDWLTIATLWTGAVLLAIKGADLPLPKGAPHFLTSPFWAFLPLCLLTIAAGLMIYKALRPTSGIKRQATSAKNEEPFDQQLEIIEGKMFMNQRVHLDGKTYKRCTFHNITLEFNGGRFGLVSNTFSGVMFETKDVHIERAWSLLQAMGFLQLPMRSEDEVRLPGHGMASGPPVQPPPA